MSELRFISGPLAGKRISLDEQQVSFGRSERCDVRLQETTVSGAHFSVVREMGEYYVVDSNSTNGTFVDGQRVTRAKLQDGNRITVGSHVIEFKHHVTANLATAGSAVVAPPVTSSPDVFGELHFLDGPMSGKRVTIEAVRTSFGRSENTDVRLPEKIISRTHFFIEREGEHFFLADNNSANGTSLNGQRILREKLADADQIRVGPHLMQFSVRQKAQLAEAIAATTKLPPGRLAPIAASIPLGGTLAPHVFAVRSETGEVPNAEYHKERITIGRGLECDIVLHDTYVARHHATIEHAAPGYTITDQHTAEGTTVNGARIVSHAVKIGEVINIGTYELRAQFVMGGLAFHLSRREEKPEPIEVKGKTTLLKMPAMISAASQPTEVIAAVPDAAAKALDLQPPETDDSILSAYLSLESSERRARPPRWVPTSDHQKPWKLKVSIYSAAAAAAILVVLFGISRTKTFVPESLSASHLHGKPRLPITIKASDGSCSACHTPVQGIDLARCNTCHVALVSVKHSTARLNCLDCHTEHHGEDFNPSLVARLACVKCHNGQHTVLDAATGREKVLPIPHGGRPMGYPVENGQWHTVSAKDAKPLTKEEFHLRHTSASVGCLSCHSRISPIDRDTPRLTCSACHGGKNLVAGERITINCTSCHNQHGEHTELKSVVKNFAQMALTRPWDHPAGPTEGPGPVAPPPPASKSSQVLMISGIALGAGIPLMLVGAVFVTMRAKRKAYFASLSAAEMPVESGARQPEWGMKSAAVARADALIKMGEAGLKISGTALLPALASIEGPIPEESIPRDHAHPIVEVNLCVGCKACVEACPFNVFDLVNGKAVPTRIAACMGDTVCAVVCPTYAIKIKGVDKVVQTSEMPDVSDNYETNVKGLYCIGDLTGLPLIKNAINMGKKVIDVISQAEVKGQGEYDVAIVGIGPAGLSATLSAKAAGLKYVALEQGERANTIHNYPRHKLVLAEPINIPLFGPLEMRDAQKEELLELWDRIIADSGIQIFTNRKVASVSGEEGNFVVRTENDQYSAKKVVLAIGSRGTPRKLGVPGESLPKVSYSLVDAAAFQHKHVLLVGGGDSALEACIALAAQGTNTVTLSYRKDKFDRAKSRNIAKMKEALTAGAVNFIPSSNVKEIRETDLVLKTKDGEQVLPNDYVIILIGGEIPKPFLEKAGIRFARRPLTIA